MDNKDEYLYRAATHSKRALITGGAGFIGSHLAETLLKRGYWVTIIDDLSTGRLENIAHLVNHPRFKFAIDTIMNEVVMDRLVSECETIYHLAAAVGVRLIVERPVHTIQTNVMGTEAVLRIARRYQAKVMIASTSEVYGKGNSIPFREDDDVVLGPTSRSRWSYAATKMVDEFHGLAYYEKFNLPVVIFRLFNTVGPRQIGQYGMVVPRFVEQALSKTPLTVYADGLQSRCFMHVQDAVDAIIALAESEKTLGEVFNVGSIEETTILDLARKVLQTIYREEQLPSPSDERIRYIPYEEAYTKGFEDMKRRVPDIQKIQTAVGWRPKRNLNEILSDVISSVQNT